MGGVGGLLGVCQQEEWQELLFFRNEGLNGLMSVRSC